MDLSGLFLLVAKKNHIPVRVAHSHNTSKKEGRYGKIKGFIRDRIIWNIMQKLISFSANRYVGCSENAAKWLFEKKIIDKRNYDVITNGIDLEKFSNKEKHLHVPVELIFVGRLIYQKNPEFVLDIFNEVLKTMNAHLTIIGDGTLASTIKQKIDQYNLQDKITWIKQTDMMTEYYKNADILLLPSHYEGLPFTLIEAQAAGIKCLASDKVDPASQCGCCVYKSLDDSIQKWGDYLKDVLHDKRLHPDEQLLYRYSIEKTVKEIENIYKIGRCR